MFEDFDKYQETANSTAIYPNKVNKVNKMGNFVYPLLGLAGETGEVFEKFKKIVRDKGGVISDKDKQEIVKELGDVLWHLAAVCTELEVDLSQVVKVNVEKIKSRKKRAKIQGKGDNR